MTAPGHPGVILGTLAAALRDHGVARMYGAASLAVGVLSIEPGLTIWCDGTRLCWTRDGQRAIWPASDPQGAADELAKLAKIDGT